MGEKKRILLVDDEPSFTRLLKLNLEQQGPYEVTVENDGAKVVAAARALRPHLILLDVIMPDVDGGAVAAELRADPMLRDTPVVFLTAVVSKSEVRQRGDTIAGHSFLAKPVSVDEVLRCIEGQLG